MLNNLRASRHVYGVGELHLWEFAYIRCPGVSCIIHCNSSARMFTYLGICTARLLYAGFPACELRDTVIALAYMLARGGSGYHGSLTHVCQGGIYTTRLFDARFPGWNLYRTVLGHTFGRVESIGTAGSRSFLCLGFIGSAWFSTCLSGWDL